MPDNLTNWTELRGFLSEKGDFHQALLHSNPRVVHRREVETRFTSLIFANMRLANLVPTSQRWVIVRDPVVCVNKQTGHNDIMTMMEIGAQLGSCGFVSEEGEWSFIPTALGFDIHQFVRKNSHSRKTWAMCILQCPGLTFLKMIDLKSSNIIWICCTAYRYLETIHMRSIDTDLFCVQLYVKIHVLCVYGKNFQSYRRT